MLTCEMTYIHQRVDISLTYTYLNRLQGKKKTTHTHTFQVKLYIYKQQKRPKELITITMKWYTVIDYFFYASPPPPTHSWQKVKPLSLGQHSLTVCSWWNCFKLKECFNYSPCVTLKTSTDIFLSCLCSFDVECTGLCLCGSHLSDQSVD